jgi:hypothetical protein
LYSTAAVPSQASGYFFKVLVKESHRLFDVDLAIFSPLPELSKGTVLQMKASLSKSGISNQGQRSSKAKWTGRMHSLNIP